MFLLDKLSLLMVIIIKFIAKVAKHIETQVEVW